MYSYVLESRMRLPRARFRDESSVARVRASTVMAPSRAASGFAGSNVNRPATWSVFPTTVYGDPRNTSSTVKLAVACDESIVYTPAPLPSGLVESTFSIGADAAAVGWRTLYAV